jgi:hypothetical protein
LPISYTRARVQKHCHVVGNGCLGNEASLCVSMLVTGVLGAMQITAQSPPPPPTPLYCVCRVRMCVCVHVCLCACVCVWGGGGYAAGFVLVGRCAEHTSKLQDTSDTTTSTPPPLPPRMRVQANTFAFILAPDPLSAPWKRTSEPKPKGWQGQCHIEGIPI